MTWTGRNIVSRLENPPGGFLAIYRYTIAEVPAGLVLIADHLKAFQLFDSRQPPIRGKTMKTRKQYIPARYNRALQEQEKNGGHIAVIEKQTSNDRWFPAQVFWYSHEHKLTEIFADIGHKETHRIILN